MRHRNLRFMLVVSTIYTPFAAAPAPARQAVPAPAQQDDAPLPPDSLPTEEPATAAAGDAITVTGSLFRTADPSADVKVYTAEDIKALGVSNVQDFFRLLPQNQASVGYGINNRRNTEVAFDDGGLGGLGVGGVNLRGLGTKNTLVLVNGRRIAGAAGIEDGFVNINNIPLAAIDRIEVSLGGGSAIYGAAALGGVVNFILKRGYKGFSATTRSEYSDTGAHTAQGTLTGAHSWGSGSVTGSVSYTRILPALNRRLGYTTDDYSDRFTREQLTALGRGNLTLDGRSYRNGTQPAALVVDYAVPGDEPGGTRVEDVLQWAGGTDYADRSRDDLRPVDLANLPSRITEDAGERQTNIGFSLSAEQRITDRLRLTFDYLGSINRSNLREVRELVDLNLIPFDQAYSPLTRADFPAVLEQEPNGISVYHYPDAEIADGRLRRGFQRSTSRSHNLTGGAVYEFDKDTAIRANYTWSVSTASGRQRGMQNVVAMNSEGGCEVNQAIIDNDQLEIPNLTQVAALQCDALFSTDPAKAFNFLNDGSSTVGAPVSVFSVEQKNLANRSTQRNGDMVFTAAPFSLPGGKVNVAVGGEFRRDGVRGERIGRITLQPARSAVYAAYTEWRVPVIGRDMDIPAIDSLELSLSARYDRYDFNGPIGTVDDVPVEQGGEVVLRDVTIDRVSPRVGFAWSPAGPLTLRGAWSSNFTPPPFTSLYDIRANQTFPSILTLDPLSPDGNPFQLREIPTTFAANPALKPETSQSFYVTATLAPFPMLAGLNVEASYYNTTINDQLGTSDDLQALLPPQLYYANPDFFTRDAAGFIVARTIKAVNIGQIRTESVEVKVDYTIQSPIGAITPSLYYIRNLRQASRASRDASPIERVGTAEGLDRYRIIGYVDVQGQKFSARLTGRYIPPYGNNYGTGFSDRVRADTDGDGQPDQPFPVDSLTTFDLNMSWRPNATATITAGGRNIFAAKPPFALIDGRPFDASRYDIRGRVLYLEAQLNF